MTKTAKQILTSLDKGEYPGLGGVDAALKELEAIHQQEIAKARIDELNRIDAANKGNGISFWFESAQEAGLNNGWRTMREYVPERIAELSQTLKEHKEKL